MQSKLTHHIIENINVSQGTTKTQEDQLKKNELQHPSQVEVGAANIDKAVLCGMFN